MFVVSGNSNADEVIKSVHDTSAGHVIGGWSSVLIEGILGGPIGAIAGDLAGAWAGGNMQELAGKSGNSYVIKQEDNTEQLIRSPNHTFKTGDKVKVVGIRVIPIENKE